MLIVVTSGGIMGNVYFIFYTLLYFQISRYFLLSEENYSICERKPKARQANKPSLFGRLRRWLKQQKCIPHSAGGYACTIKVQAVLFSFEAFLLGCPLAALWPPCVHTGSWCLNNYFPESVWCRGLYEDSHGIFSALRIPAPSAIRHKRRVLKRKGEIL